MIDASSNGMVKTAYESKFKISFILAVAAKYGRVGITDFTEDRPRGEELLDFKLSADACLSFYY